MLVDFIESTVNRKLGDAERNLVIHGADEVDIVRSGLDDTMTNACAETRKTALEKVLLSYFALSYSHLIFRTKEHRFPNSSFLQRYYEDQGCIRVLWQPFLVKPPILFSVCTVPVFAGENKWASK